MADNLEKVTTLSLLIVLDNGKIITLKDELLKTFIENANPDSAYNPNDEEIWDKIFSAVKKLPGYKKFKT